MLIDALLAILHWLAVGTTAATLFAEWLLLRWHAPLQHPTRMAGLDLVYFLAAMMALATGLLRVFYGAKGSEFYTIQPAFWLKIGLFALVGAISIAPTQRFVRWKKGTEAVNPANVAIAYRWVSVQLGLLLLFPVLASSMARALFS